MKRRAKVDYARWVFVLPALLVVGILLIYPIFSSLYYSMTNKQVLIYLENTQTLINQGLRGTTTAEFGNGDCSLWEGLPQFMEMVTAVSGMATTKIGKGSRSLWVVVGT